MNIRLLFLLILPLTLASCVSQQKYSRAVDAQARMNLLRQQYLAENDRLSAELDSLRQNTTFIADASNTEISLDSNMITDDDELVSKNVEMGATRGMVLNTTARVENSEPIVSPQILEVQQKEKIINQLISDLDKALNGFRAEELNMRAETDGVHITIHENILFKNGDLSIDERGKQALKALAEVVNSNPQSNILIEGHIDTPTAEKNGTKNSWQISVERAISIGQILNKSYGIKGDRMIVSGRGDFKPLAQNEYPMARMLNRRVEVIIVPVINN